MNKAENRLVSRQEIADLAGVSRALLSVWKKRHPSFPLPRSSAEGEFFVFAEMLEWLTTRPIPAGQLLPTEVKGCTYADRILQNTRAATTEPSSQSVAGKGSGEQRTDQADAFDELFGPLAQRVRGGGPQMDYLQLLLCAVFVRVCAPGQWARATDLVAEAVADQGDPAKLLDSIATIADVVLREHGVLPGMRPVFARLQPTAVEDVAQVLRTCHGLDRDSFEPILDRFAEWSHRDSNELFTPRAVVQLVTDVLLGEVTGTVQCHDPYLRSGEFLSGAASMLSEATSMVRGMATSGFGRSPEQLRIAAMHTAVHGVDVADLRQGDALASGTVSEQPMRFDVVMTNPPFNQRSSNDWPAPPGGWPFDAPPKKNGNFAWLQHVYASLDDGGRAAVVMPNQAGVSEDKAEHAIRAAMVEHGVVECVVALPPGLFPTTPVPVSVWFLARRKEVPDSVLLIDARAAGQKRGGRRRLSDQDLRSIVDCLQEWRTGAADFDTKDLSFGGIAVAADLAAIRRLAHSLSPADYRPVPGVTSTENAVPLSALCKIQAGPSNDVIKKLPFTDHGVPIVAPAQLRHRGITDEHTKWARPEDAARLGKYQLTDQDILCSRTGTLGPCAIADSSAEGMLFATGLIRLRVRDPEVVDPRYLIAFLSLPSTVTWIANRAAGTTIPSISSANLGKLLVPLPSLDEQGRIGAAVCAADAGIMALHKQIQIAEGARTDAAIALFAGLPSSGRTAARPEHRKVMPGSYRDSGNHRCAGQP
ncbi:N-6 DNA methylase [Nocardia sp. NPDC059177]|uniref:N-6 DNA methylase n=1 Tax=Nocardia sp. NPDC059177 TaxID=3346759 RepID=UPI0036BD438A